MGLKWSMTMIWTENAKAQSNLGNFILNIVTSGARKRDADGEPVEGRLAYEEIYAQAQKSIFVVDNYIGLGTLLPLKAARPGVAVTIATDNVGHGLHASEFAAFRAEYPGVDVSFVRTCGKVHDRYIALDFGTRNERAFL